MAFTETTFGTWHSPRLTVITTFIAWSSPRLRVISTFGTWHSPRLTVITTFIAWSSLRLRVTTTFITWSSPRHKSYHYMHCMAFNVTHCYYYIHYMAFIVSRSGRRYKLWYIFWYLWKTFCRRQMRWQLRRQTHGIKNILISRLLYRQATHPKYTEIRLNNWCNVSYSSITLRCWLNSILVIIWHR